MHLQKYEVRDGDGARMTYQKCTVFRPIGLFHAVLNQLSFAAPCASVVVPWNRRAVLAVFLANADVNWVREALLRMGRAVRKRVAIAGSGA